VNTFQQETNAKFLSFRASKLKKKKEKKPERRKHKLIEKYKAAYFDVVLDQFRKSCQGIAAPGPSQSCAAGEVGHRSGLGRGKFGLVWVEQHVHADVASH